MTLLPRPTGDPVAMRAAAQALRSDAFVLDQLAQRLSTTISGMVFEGPAARAMTQRATNDAVQLRAAARTVEDAARTLETGAGGVERARAEYDAARRRLQAAQKPSGR